MKQDTSFKIRDGITLASSYLAFPLIALISGPLAARVLGPHGRGEVAAIMAPIGIAENLATFGLPIAAAYFTTRGVPARVVFRKCLPIAVLAGALGCLALVALAPLLLTQQKELVTLLRLASLYVPLVVFISVIRGIQNGRARYSLLSAERWTQALTRLALMVCAVVAGVYFTESAVLINVAAAVLASLILLRRTKPVSPETQAAHPAHVSTKEVFGFSLRAWGVQVGAAANTRIDQAILVPFVGMKELGLYAVAAMAVDLPASFFSAAQKVALGSAAGHDRQQQMQRVARISVTFGLLVTLFCVPLAPLFLTALFGAEFQAGITSLQVLLLGLTPWGLSQIMTSALSGINRPGAAAIAETAALVITLALLPFAAMRMGIEGAALVSVLSYIVAAGLKCISWFRTTGCRAPELLVLSRGDIAWIKSQLARRTKRMSPRN